MKISLIRLDSNKLIAAHDSDLEKVQKLKKGEIYECNITKPRNGAFHRKYWALMNLVFSNQEIYTDINDLRADITIEAGFYTERYNIYAEVVKKAKSASFAKMDELEFSELYSKSIDVIIKYFKFDNSSIEREVEQFY